MFPLAPGNVDVPQRSDDDPPSKDYVGKLKPPRSRFSDTYESYQGLLAHAEPSREADSEGRPSGSRDPTPEYRFPRGSRPSSVIRPLPALQDPLHLHAEGGHPFYVGKGQASVDQSPQRREGKQRETSDIAVRRAESPRRQKVPLDETELEYLRRYAVARHNITKESHLTCLKHQKELKFHQDKYHLDKTAADSAALMQQSRVQYEQHHSALLPARTALHEALAALETEYPLAKEYRARFRLGSGIASQRPTRDTIRGLLNAAEQEEKEVEGCSREWRPTLATTTTTTTTKPKSRMSSAAATGSLRIRASVKRLTGVFKRSGRGPGSA